MKKEIYITRVNNWYDLKAQSWNGALQTLEAIEEKGKEEEFIDLLNNIISCEEDQKIEETKLNDFIWFDTDYIEEVLDVKLWGDNND